MENNFNIIQNPDGTYTVRGLRFGESSSPKPSSPIVIKKGALSSIITDVPYRETYGSYKDQSRVTKDSQYDDDIVGLHRLEEGYTIDELRGEAQPWYDQIANGLTKMTVLAGTTFADAMGGTIAGIVNIAANLDKIKNSDNPLVELGDQFINNPWSVKLTEINEKMENVAANYYTKEENESPWYENIFTANFIGDKFLKNMGFTIGAAYSAKVTAGLMSKAMGLKGVRDAFKGVVTTASGKVLTNADEIAKAYKTGDAFMDGVKLTEDLGKAAKKLKNAEWNLKMLGAVNSAMGEARIEAVHGTKSWADYHIKLLEDSYKSQRDAIEYSIYQEHPEWFSLVDRGDGRYVRTITNPAGLAEWNKRAEELETKKDEAIKKIQSDRAKMANAIFAANTAFLTGSNAWQYGRFITGGYTTGRQAKNLVKGSLKEGFTENKNIARKELLKAISNPFVEANEEMTQALIEESSGLKYASELNNFFGAKVNPEAEETTAGWLNSIMKGASNTYGNTDRWEEGFLGFVTGGLGIPSISFKKNANGKTRPSLSFEGELWESIKDAKKVSKESRDIAQALNQRIQSPDFLNYYQGAIRHSTYQKEMENALDKGDNYTYKNNEHSQFISDAIMFDKAGRLQDLYDIMDEAGNITADDVADIRSMTIDKNTGKSIFEGKTDQEVLSHVKRQVEDARKKLDSYVEISNNLKALYGDNISSDNLEELTWMITQVDDWENRTKSIINNLHQVIGEKAQVLSERFGVNVNTTLGNLEWMVTHLPEDGNIIDEINSIIDDKNLSVEEGRNRIETLVKEKELRRRDSNLELGRRITQIRRDFKNTRDRLEKQRQKLLKQIDVAEADKSEFQVNTAEYKKKVEDNEKAQIALIKETRDRIEKIKDTIFKPKYKNQKTSRRLEKRQQDLFDTANELGGYIEELDEMLANKEINYARLNDIMNMLETRIFAIEGKFMSETVFDARTKLGYMSGQQKMSRPKTDKEGNILRDSKGNIIYEDTLNAEEQARIQHREEQESLFSQIIALKDMLNAEEYQLVDPLNTKKLSEDLIDLIKLYSARSKFIDKYTQLANNPELFTEEAQKVIDSAITALQDKEVNKTLNAVSSVKTLKELRDKLNDVDEETKSKVLEKLKNSEDEEVNNIATQYEEIEDSRKVINDIIASKPSSPEIISANNIITDALDNSNTLEEAKLVIADSIRSVDKPVSDAILDIMDTYVEHMSSEESTKKDKKKPKRKPKKKSLLDVATDEVTSDAEMLESSAGAKSSSHIEDEEDEDDIEDDDTEDKTPRRVATPAESIRAASSEDLDDVTKDKSSLRGVKKGSKEAAAVKEIATRELSNRKNPPIHSDDEDSSDGNSETNSSRNTETVADYMRSWAVTQYNIDDLKDRSTRKAVRYNDPRVQELIRLGAFEFVDSGKLGDLFNKNNDLPIHYISVSSGVLTNDILLAIKVTKDVEPINAITAQDGEQYQVIGTLGFEGSSWKSGKSFNYVKDFITNEKEGNTSTYFVSSLTNKIRHIYSGRMVKSSDTEKVEQRSLKSILNGEKPHFGIYYKDGDFRTPTLDEETDIIVPLNKHNSNPREGSLWLMTKEADGRYYAKAVKVSRFDSNYDVEANIETPLIKRIIEDITVIVDSSKSDEERSLAKYDLEEILYFPEGTSILFNNDVVSIEGYKNNIGKGLSIEDKATALFNELYNDDLGLRFQVSSRKLAKEGYDSEYVEDLLNSNILTTDILQLHNVNASFDLFLHDTRNGNLVKDKTPPLGHTGSRAINSEIAGDTIIHNGKTFKVTNEGVYSGTTKITNQDTIDEVLFIQKIKNKEVNPVEGNSRLYLGSYSNGLQFGVVNYKIKKGEELEKLLKEAHKKASKAEKEDIRSAFEHVRAKDSRLPYELSDRVPLPTHLREEEEDSEPSMFEEVSSEDSTLPYSLYGREEEKDDEEGTTMLDALLDAASEDSSVPPFARESNKKGRGLLDSLLERSEKEEELEAEGPSISTAFDSSTTRSVKDLSKENNTFDTLVRTNKNRRIIRELGFSSIDDFKNHIMNSNLNLPDIDTITDQESFDSLIETIKNCR